MTVVPLRLTRALAVLACLSFPVVALGDAAPQSKSAADSRPEVGKGGLEETPAAAEEPPSLENKIPPVSGQAFFKAGRVEISPFVGFSFNDAFFEKFMPELQIAYHFNDSFSLGVRGGYAFDIAAGHVNSCDSQGNCGAPTAAQLQQLPGQITGAGTLEAAWSPVYGKVNLLAEKVFHFDFSLLLGAGAFLMGPQPSSPSSAWAPLVAPGLGERFFFGSSIAIAAEVRDYLYGSGGVQNQLMFNLGLAFFLGSPRAQKD